MLILFLVSVTVGKAGVELTAPPLLIPNPASRP